MLRYLALEMNVRHQYVKDIAEKLEELERTRALSTPAGEMPELSLDDIRAVATDCDDLNALAMDLENYWGL